MAGIITSPVPGVPAVDAASLIPPPSKVNHPEKDQGLKVTSTIDKGPGQDGQGKEKGEKSLPNASVTPAAGTARDSTSDGICTQDAMLPPSYTSAVQTDIISSPVSVFPPESKPSGMITYANRRKSWNVKPGTKRRLQALQKKKIQGVPNVTPKRVVRKKKQIQTVPNVASNRVVHQDLASKEETAPTQVTEEDSKEKIQTIPNMAPKSVVQQDSANSKEETVPAKVETEEDSKEWFKKQNDKIIVVENEPAEKPTENAGPPVVTDVPYTNPTLDQDVLDQIKTLWVYQHKTQGLFTYKRGRHKPPIETIRSMFGTAYGPVVAVARMLQNTVASGATPLPKLIRLDIEQIEARKRERKSAMEKIEIKSPNLYGLEIKSPNLYGLASSKKTQYFRPLASTSKRSHSTDSSSVGEPSAKKSLFSPRVEICLSDYPSEDDEEIEPQIDTKISQKLVELIDSDSESELESHISEEGEIVWLGQSAKGTGATIDTDSTMGTETTMGTSTTKTKQAKRPTRKTKTKTGDSQLSLPSAQDDNKPLQATDAPLKTETDVEFTESAEIDIVAQNAVASETLSNDVKTVQSVPNERDPVAQVVEAVHASNVRRSMKLLKTGADHPLALSPTAIKDELATPPATPITPLDDPLLVQDSVKGDSGVDSKPSAIIPDSGVSSLSHGSVLGDEYTENKSHDDHAITPPSPSDDSLDRFSISPPPPVDLSEAKKEKVISAVETKPKAKEKRKGRKRKLTAQQDTLTENTIPQNEELATENGQDIAESFIPENSPGELPDGEKTNEDPIVPKQKRQRKQKDPLQAAVFIQSVSSPTGDKPVKRRARRPRQGKKAGENRTVRDLLGQVAREAGAQATSKDGTPSMDMQKPPSRGNTARMPSISSRDSTKRSRKPTQRLLESIESGWNYDTQWSEVLNGKDPNLIHIKSEPPEATDEHSSPLPEDDTLPDSDNLPQSVPLPEGTDLKQKKSPKAQLPKDDNDTGVSKQSDVADNVPVSIQEGEAPIKVKKRRRRTKLKDVVPEGSGDTLGNIEKDETETVPVSNTQIGENQPMDKTESSEPIIPEWKASGLQPVASVQDYSKEAPELKGLLQRGPKTGTRRKSVDKEAWQKITDINYLREELKQKYAVKTSSSVSDITDEKMANSDVIGFEKNKAKQVEKTAEVQNIKAADDASKNIGVSGPGGVAPPQVIFIPVAQLGGMQSQFVQPGAPVYFIRPGHPPFGPLPQGMSPSHAGSAAPMVGMQYAAPQVLQNAVPIGSSPSSGQYLVRCQGPVPVSGGQVLVTSPGGGAPHTMQMAHIQNAVGQSPIVRVSTGQPESALGSMSTPKAVLDSKLHTLSGLATKHPSPGEIISTPPRSVHGIQIQKSLTPDFTRLQATPTDYRSPRPSSVHGMPTHTPSPSRLQPSPRAHGTPTHSPSPSGPQPAPRAHSRKSSLKVLMNKPIPAHTKPANFSMYSQLKCAMEESTYSDSMGGLDLSKKSANRDSPQEQHVKQDYHQEPLALQTTVSQSPSQNAPVIPTPVVSASVSDVPEQKKAKGARKPRATKSVNGANSRARTSQTARKSTTGRQPTTKKDVPVFDGPLLSQPLCETCGKDSMFICSGCRSVAYCSVQCQAKAWENHCKICR